MVALPGADRTTTVDYLAKNFPPSGRTAAKIVPGTAKVNIREWMVPTLGSRPHDPLASADGNIWWTGQYASRLGRLDVKTGDLKEFPLKTPESGPHGLVEDRSGNIWFTAISKNYIGRLDPEDRRGHRVSRSTSPARAGRTRRSSTRRARCSSRCNPDTSAGSCRPPA